MAKKKEEEKSFVEAVFDGVSAAEKLANSENTKQPQPITPVASNGFNGFGTPMMPQPAFPYDPQAAAAIFQQYSECCKSLIPGTTIGTYIRCTGAEFVIDNWKLGALYRIESTEHQCVAFLTKKTPEALEFSSVDDEGNAVVFEIKANDLCCDFQEKTESYPFSRMIRVPTNPIVIFPLR